MKSRNEIDTRNLISRLFVAFIMVAALGLTALPTLAGGGNAAAEAALKKLDEKIDAVIAAREALKTAQDDLAGAMDLDRQDGPGTSAAMEETLENLRNAVANAQAALEKAEAEARAALNALEDAIAEVDKDSDRSSFRRRRDGALSRWWTRSTGGKLQFALRDTLEGTVTVEMTADNGNIKLYLPNDMQPGDIITGSVEARDTASLSGVVLEIDGKKNPIRDRMVSFVVPATAGAAGLQLVLKNSMGREVARGEAPANLFSGNVPTQLGANFAPPSVGQTGRDLVIQGKFDGLPFTETVRLGSTMVPLIAESPRKAVFVIPANAPVGPTTLEISNQQNKVENFKFNLASIELKADKLNLTRGESTILHITVRGLEGLQESEWGSIRLVVQNQTPQVINMNFSNKWSQLGSSSESAVFYRLADESKHQRPTENIMMNFTEKITGITPGGFRIDARINLGKGMYTWMKAY